MSVTRGDETHSGVIGATLLLVKGEWKIAHLHWTHTTSPGNSVLSEVTADHMASLDAISNASRVRNWDGILDKWAMPGAGGTIWSLHAGAEDEGPKHSRISEHLPWLMQLVSSMPKEAVFDEQFSNVEVRECGGTAVLWAPMRVEIGGKVVTRGIDCFTMVHREGRWMVSGSVAATRDTSE